MSWNKLSDQTVQVFQRDEQPEIIYVIQTGFVNPIMYLIVHEDGYDMISLNTNPNEFLTKEQIEEKYKITLL